MEPFVDQLFGHEFLFSTSIQVVDFVFELFQCSSWFVCKKNTIYFPLDFVIGHNDSLDDDKTFELLVECL